MARGGNDRNRDVAGFEIADAMGDRQPHDAETLACFVRDPFEFGDRHLFVRFVREPGDRPAVVGPVAHDPQKGDDAAAAASARRRLDRVRVDRRALDAVRG